MGLAESNKEWEVNMASPCLSERASTTCSVYCFVCCNLCPQDTFRLLAKVAEESSVDTVAVIWILKYNCGAHTPAAVNNQLPTRDHCLCVHVLFCWEGVTN